MLVYLVHFKTGEPLRPGRQVSIRPEMTQNDMARLMGVHRVTVTKAISRLKSMGILAHFSKGSLLITDFQALQELIEKEDL
jgi:Mn-dependent DtxR family transcriptional regulator